jgi:hypothetical protein
MARYSFKINEINVHLTNPDQTIVIFSTDDMGPVQGDQVSMSLTTLREVMAEIDNVWRFKD